MANRPVYVPTVRPPFYDVWNVEFVWNSGLSAAQKQRNIAALHESFLHRKPDSVPLEISSKSKNPLGVNLSAFNLKKHIPSLNIDIPVENAYQGGKKYEFGGPYTDLYEQTPKDAKRDGRHNTSGSLIAFSLEGVDYPIKPKNGFYDWLYIQALLENKEMSEEVQNYNAFTDIEFNPDKSTNCQARAAAMYIGIAKAGLLDQTRDFYDFCKLITGESAAQGSAQVTQGANVAPVPEIKFSEGQMIQHPTFGEGKINSVSGGYLKIRFECGEKILGEKWVKEKCTY